MQNKKAVTYHHVSLEQPKFKAQLSPNAVKDVKQQECRMLQPFWKKNLADFYKTKPVHKLLHQFHS